jgi:predicted SAM-dependent methyltransferase
MKLHLGCGPVCLNGWVNIDLDSPLADMNLDLRLSLPFEDESVSFVFAEHFIEHVSRDDASRLMSDLFRVLRPGGVVRLVTPDLRFLAATYLAGHITEWGDLWSPKNAAHLMNEGMRDWGHQFLYDAEEFEALFHESGFTDRKRCPWRGSSIPDLSGLESRPFHQDLIFEGRKPSAGEVCEPYVYQNIADAQWSLMLAQNNQKYIQALESQLNMAQSEVRRLAAALEAGSNQISIVDNVKRLIGLGR